MYIKQSGGGLEMKGHFVDGLENLNDLNYDNK